MLISITRFEDFINKLEGRLSFVHTSQLERLKSPSFAAALIKVKLLNTDAAESLLSKLYSPRGRPAFDPTVLLRSLFLMFHLKETSIQNWHDLLKHDYLLRLLCGIFEHNPSVGTYYGFIDRLSGWDITEPILPADKNRKPKKIKKPKGKPGRKPKNLSDQSKVNVDTDFSGSPNPTRKGEKLNLNQQGATTSLAIQAQQGEIDPDRSIKLLQLLLKVLGVDVSISKGLIDPNNLDLSGDGTAVHAHSNSSGHHIKEYRGTEKYETHRRYSDPDADHGYDSDLGVYYFGYTGYFLTAHNKEKGLDLPINFMIEEAKEHDSIISIKALNQVKALYPELTIRHYCLDSASDNEATYQLCLNLGITPVIDRNVRRRGSKKCGDITISPDGIPICKQGAEMHFTAWDKSHNAFRYRCPLVIGDISECSCRDQCSNTAYGRTYYQKCDDIRDQTGLKYRSEKWNKIYSNRTSCERINNRVLNDYGLHTTKMHTKRRISFVAFMGCLHIHADAWIKAGT